MPDDGTVKLPKASAPVTAATPATPATPARPTAQITAKPATSEHTTPSFTSKVPEICARLGFSPPRYDLSQVVEGGPLWDGFADFGADPRIVGKVGEVKAVFGKKNCKEEAAKLVYAFMKDIERQRMAASEEDDKKRKREPTSSPEIHTKAAKVEA